MRLFLLYFFSFSFCWGQTLVWQKTYGGLQPDEMRAATICQDGNILIAGTIESHGQSKDIWLLKIDKSGKNLWQQTYGRGFEEEVNQVISTPDSGFLLIGTIVEDPDVEKRNKIWVIKTDEWGKIQWEKRVSAGRGLAIANAADGGYMIGGERIDRDQHFWVAKWSAKGEQEWEKTWTGVGVQQIGMIDKDNYIVAGSVGREVRVLRLTATGFPVWDISFEGDIHAMMIANKSIFFTGTSSVNKDIAQNIKIDAKGNIKWKKSLDMEGETQGNGLCMNEGKPYWIGTGTHPTQKTPFLKIGEMSPKMVASSQDLYSLIPYKMQAEFILPLAKNQFFMGATSTESGSQDLWLGALQWKQK